ncbi:MAG: hypothetical protein QOD41_2125, partial [Cryptosporangiaceae bacterium]|nr:hypothetical protein [Cryptosporangiaceae bacterium]
MPTSVPQPDTAPQQTATAPHETATAPHETAAAPHQTVTAPQQVAKAGVQSAREPSTVRSLVPASVRGAATQAIRMDRRAPVTVVLLLALTIAALTTGALVHGPS